MWRALSLAVPMLVVTIGCVDIPPDPLQLEGGILTVDNRSADDWKDVEIWINRYYRVAVPTIAAKSRFQVPLSSFVSGYSQRFDVHRAVIRDLRLTAKGPEGKPVAITRDTRTGREVLGGKK